MKQGTEVTLGESGKQETKVVPPRNDMVAQPVFVKATVADQAGVRPGYTRRWFYAGDGGSVAKGHPSYYGRNIVSRQIGDAEIGYCEAAPWRIVSADEAKPGGRPRDDQGKGIETALLHGDLICLETTNENAAIYDAYDRKKDEAKTARLGRGDTENIAGDNGQGVASYKARVGASPSQTHRDLLDQPQR